MGVEEINKPGGSWCIQCVPGGGCKIYDRRPKQCRDYECAWLAHAFPDWLKPNKVHFVIVAKEKSITLHVDQHYPSAWKHRRVLDYFENLVHKHGLRLFVQVGNTTFEYAPPTANATGSMRQRKALAALR
jgi:hypothetical protein